MAQSPKQSSKQPSDQGRGFSELKIQTPGYWAVWQKVKIGLLALVAVLLVVAAAVGARH